MPNYSITLHFTEVFKNAIVSAPTALIAQRTAESFFRTKELTQPMRLESVGITETTMPEDLYITAFKAETDALATAGGE